MNTRAARLSVRNASNLQGDKTRYSVALSQLTDSIRSQLPLFLDKCEMRHGQAD